MAKWTCWTIQSALESPHRKMKSSYARVRTESCLPRPRQHQSDVIRLLVVADPVVDRRSDRLADLHQRQAPVRAHEVNEPFFAEFSELIFRLGDAVAVRQEDFPR